jgi:Holliday junction resolvase RusA-like endonuclease
VEIRFRVFGLPQTKGSTKAFMRPGMRYPVVTNDNVKNAGWAATVKGEAQRAVREGGAGLPWAGAVGLALTFWLKKPQRHPKRRSVPAIKKPDLDKLVRSVKDALTGTMYLDDSQVTWLTARKVYGEQPGVLIQLTKGDVR